MPRPLRVLIVEDSEDDALLVAAALKRSGYAPCCRRVETAEAMRAALGEQTWDIIICDHALPRFSAPAALAILKDSGLDLPFIVVSGSVGEDAAVAMMRDGAHDYVMKGNLTRLAPAVERELTEAEQRRKRHQTEQALRQSESKYRTLLENLPQKIFFKDTQSVYISCNENYASDRKIKAEDVAGTTDHDFFPAQLADKYRADDKRVMECGETEEIEERYLQDGREVFVQTVKTPVRDENGSVVGILGVFWDITERKRAEEALRESEEKYRGVVDNIAIGIAVISPRMEILALNREMRTRFPHIDVANRPICHRSFYEPPRDDVCSYCPTRKTLRDGQVHEATAPRQIGSDTRYYRMLSSPLRDASEDVVGAIELVEDVTQRMKADEAMLRAGKLDSLALLAGGIAHDFNNILTGVMGNVALARVHGTPNDAAAGRLRDAEKACRQATNLTHHLLTFAKGGAPVRTIACLPQLIQDSVRFASSGSRAVCEWDIADDLWPADIDEGQIGQAIGNLVINAAQAMPDGGTVTVRARNVPRGDEEFAALGEGRYVKVSIADEGVGIPSEHLAKVFDPYFTTKKEGSGLGLATTHSIIHRHDGQITVESEPGVGTTFHMYLPASGEPAPANKEAGDELPMGAGRILVMDDEEIVRDVAGRMLNHLGYDVDFAADGTEAIGIYSEAMEAGRPFDAVIMDLTIPGGIGGREAVRKLLDIDPGVKAIASSGYSTDSAMADHEKHGFAAVVPKPYQTEDLGRAVHAAIARREELSAPAK